MDAGFEATCERCGGSQALTAAEVRELMGPAGQFVCDGCAEVRARPIYRRPKPGGARDRSGEMSYRNAQGVIVTYTLPSGEQRVEYRGGYVVEAVEHICKPLPAGATVEAISTWRTILRDLEGIPRTYGGSSKEPDAYAVERHLLGRIDRLDLLPSGAERLGSHYPSGRR